jgi:NADH-quinone oxidoreductase subunit A
VLEPQTRLMVICQEEIVSVESVVLWPLLVYFGLVLTIVLGMLGLSHFLGQRHRERATGEPYESGIPPTGSARLQVDVRFYLVAMLFVIFDLEAAFLFAWAIAFRQAGWLGYVEASVFAGVLLVALLYLWRAGVLDQAATSRGAPQPRRDEEDEQ